MSQTAVFQVRSPATGRVVWSGPEATADEVYEAVAAARDALPDWRAAAPDDRVAVLRRFADLAADRRSELASIISDETGKPRWESTAEAELLPAKIGLAIDAWRERYAPTEVALAGATGRRWHRPVGVMAVLGPFNFPMHLPHGHLAPALLAGNTAVFKPSERTPGSGAALAALWREAGLPDGVLSVVQGGRAVGQALVDADVDGVLFTGSETTGRAIHRALAGRSEVMLALELGGNNPLIVHRADDLDAAAYLTVVSAFATAGQRCTCARRLVLPESPEADALCERVVAMSRSLRVGGPDDDPPPFMGPVISAAAGRAVLETQRRWIDGGAVPLLEGRAIDDNGAMLSPGVLDVTDLRDRGDEEVFGPLLQVVRVADFDAALAEANRTRFGLAAALLSDDPVCYARFAATVRAGVLNWNRPTTGASGRLPFGGLGASGNHRPSGYHAADYCVDAGAAVESPALAMPATAMPGIVCPRDAEVRR